MLSFWEKGVRDAGQVIPDWGGWMLLLFCVFGVLFCSLYDRICGAGLLLTTGIDSQDFWTRFLACA